METGYQNDLGLFVERLLANIRSTIEHSPIIEVMHLRKGGEQDVTLASKLSKGEFTGWRAFFKVWNLKAGDVFF
jgi:hypothetical protein